MVIYNKANKLHNKLSQEHKNGKQLFGKIHMFVMIEYKYIFFTLYYDGMRDKCVPNKRIIE